MPSMSTLLDRLRADYPAVQFHADDHFEWQPGSQTILYDETDPEYESHLLHELGHATLEHSKYSRDIDLIAMERDAWQKAVLEFGPRYNVSIPSETIHHDMDTYRDWLHQRSTCPHCGSNGIQTKKKTYTCVTCRETWQVNEARTCRLQRYKQKTPDS